LTAMCRIADIHDDRALNLGKSGPETPRQSLRLPSTSPARGEINL
jgi:hypothetical protein